MGPLGFVVGMRMHMAGEVWAMPDAPPWSAAVLVACLPPGILLSLPIAISFDLQLSPSLIHWGRVGVGRSGVHAPAGCVDVALFTESRCNGTTLVSVRPIFRMAAR